MRNLEVFPIRSHEIIGWGDSVVDNLIATLSHGRYQLLEGDVVVVTSKVISMEEMTRVKLDDISPSPEAETYASLSKLDPRLVEIILKQSEKVFGAVYHALLTKSNDGLSANAGIDLSNAPNGYALLLPKDCNKAARDIRKALQEWFNVDKIAVIITDSRTIPLRRGTMAVALGIAGMDPVIDDRGKKDLYDYTMTITSRATADNIATAANLVMGESNEQIPFALIRGVDFSHNENSTIAEAIMPEKECLYFGPLLELTEENRKSSKMI